LVDEDAVLAGFGGEEGVEGVSVVLSCVCCATDTTVSVSYCWLSGMDLDLLVERDHHASVLCVPGDGQGYGLQQIQRPIGGQSGSWSHSSDNDNRL
jgi:hypothetical protein